MINELVFSTKNECLPDLLSKTTNLDETRIINLAVSKIFQKGKVDAAKLEQLIQENSTVSFSLILALQKEDPARALDYARALIEQHPSNPLFQALTAYLAEKAGEILIATQSIEDAMVIWSDEPSWHVLASRLYQKIGNNEFQVEHLQSAADLDPENPTLLLALGKSLMQIGKIDQSIQVLENSIRITEKMPEPWLFLALAYKSKGNISKARKCSENALTLNPKETRALLIQGEIDLEGGDVFETIKKAEQVLSSDPSDEEAILLYVKALIRNREYEKVLLVIDKVNPTLRDPLPILLQKIGVLNELKGPAITLEYLHELNTQYPANPDILGQMAKAYLAIGNSIDAEKAAQSSLLANNTQAEMYLLCGRLQRKSGNLDQAIYNLGEAIRITPMNIEPYLELGKAYQDRREYILAIHTYQKAIQLFPNDPKPYYQARITFRENKEFDNAETMLRKASELAPEDTNIRRQLFALVALNLVTNSQESSIPS